MDLKFKEKKSEIAWKIPSQYRHLVSQATGCTRVTLVFFLLYLSNTLLSILFINTFTSLFYYKAL